MGDAVNNPDHYQQFPVEVIEITEHLNFCMGNAVKYILRADFKGNAIQDLEKARWYIDREIRRRKEQDDAVDQALEDLKVGDDPAVQWGDPETPTQKARAEAIRDLIEDDVIQVGLSDPYGAFAGRNLEAMDRVGFNTMHAAALAQNGLFQQTFIAGIAEEDLTEEQKQRVAEQTAKPRFSNLKPTHRKNPDGSITEISTGKVVAHVSGPPIEIKSFNWVEDYDAEHRKFAKFPVQDLSKYQDAFDDTIRTMVRMYAVPPEQHP